MHESNVSRGLASRIDYRSKAGQLDKDLIRQLGKRFYTIGAKQMQELSRSDPCGLKRGFLTGFPACVGCHVITVKILRQHARRNHTLNRCLIAVLIAVLRWR